MRQLLLLLSLMIIANPIFAVDTAQTAVINNAMGGYMGSNTLDNLIKWAIAIGYLLWMAWISISSYSSWADSESSIADMSYTIVTASAITMLVVWIVT